MVCKNFLALLLQIINQVFRLYQGFVGFKLSDLLVHDPKRVDFLIGYLRQLKRAIDEGIPVLGYQHWSILDNFEWAEGYDPRFGLVYVDFQSGERIPKGSARVYKKIIESNGSVLSIPHTGFGPGVVAIPHLSAYRSHSQP